MRQKLYPVHFRIGGAVLVLLTACIIFSTVRTPTVAVRRRQLHHCLAWGIFLLLQPKPHPALAGAAGRCIVGGRTICGCQCCRRAAASTRWGSAFTNNEWIYVDLGSTTTISRVVLNWEAAYGSGYQIQVSDNATTWTTIFTTTTGNGAIDDLTVSGSGRYVRMLGTARATQWGYSLFEFQVFGTVGAAATLLSQGRPVVASSAEGPCGCQCCRRRRRHPLGQRLHQQRVDLRRPGLHRHHQPRSAELGNRLWQRLSDPGLQQRDDLDHHLHHHHRQCGAYR